MNTHSTGGSFNNLAAAVDCTRPGRTGIVDWYFNQGALSGGPLDAPEAFAAGSTYDSNTLGVAPRLAFRG